MDKTEFNRMMTLVIDGTMDLKDAAIACAEYALELGNLTGGTDNAIPIALGMGQIFAQCAVVEISDNIKEERDRARTLAKNLFLMIPKEIWRDHGGDDGQGHYEGDYHAEWMEQEIKSWEMEK